jgi:formimidoylglutamate deiminase
MSKSRIFAPHALLPTGWARDVLLAWDADGRLTSVQAGASAAADVPRAAGPLLPGMPNLHSHAFQRGFAGLTEYRSVAQGGDPAGADSFWSWRTQMYRFALRLSPDTLEAVATQLYIEMLRAGYTSESEFHYVHRDIDGKPYADAAEMSLRLLRAAQRAGIGMTLLPVLYQTAGFGDKPPLAEQRRFLQDTDAMLKLLERLAPACSEHGARLGLAPHSLRAVPPQSLTHALAGLHAIDPTAPVHIHIAEQQREVDDCIAWAGIRPVEWLLDHAEVDARWCLVHATHMDWDERRRLAHSGAVAGICPTTEANLGDGVFEAAPYMAQHGAWGIGSDSHASVSVAEELRMFEYGQRLALQQRNVLASESHLQVADRLYLEAVTGGARAAGRAVAGLAAGQQADFVVLDGAHPALAGLDGAQALATHVFANHGHETLAEVRTAGRCRVQHGAHPLQAEAGRLFVAARASLLGD